MAARLVNNVKYIALLDDNNFKLKSFNNCIYYTLRDIFWNSDEHSCIKANDLNSLLVKEKTDINVEYTNVLDDLSYIKKFYKFLKLITETNFDFVKEPFDEEEKYIEFNIWLEQLQILIKNLEKLIIEKGVIFI